MGTVLIDRYLAYCRHCGWREEFPVGAGMGDLHAVRRARELHAQAHRVRQTACDTGSDEVRIEVTSRA